MTAEDDWFNEHPHGRDGLGPAPASPLRSWLDDHFTGPSGGDGDGGSAAKPNVTYRTRGPYFTAGTLRNALNWAEDDDRIEVHGKALMIYKQD